jgi:hypothetical protein
MGRMKSHNRVSSLVNFMKFRANPIRHRRNVWPWFVGASVLLGVVYAIVPVSYRSSSVLLTAVGSLWALAFYLHGRHAEDARFVKELLTDFNQRYDNLGTDLQRAMRIHGAFDVDAQLRFVKYFNLCAEEWLFWRSGYIYDPVWRAWENGMKQYAPDPRVIALWKKECATDSYYGFEFPPATIEGTSSTTS